MSFTFEAGETGTGTPGLLTASGGEVTAGAVGAADDEPGTVLFTALSITLRETLGWEVARYASAKLVQKKVVANTPVALDMKFADPVAPNKLPDDPPPKAAPISAPLPC